MIAERRIAELGLILPQAPQLPPGVEIPFSWIRIRDSRAYLAGHSAQATDGSFPGPFGSTPDEVSLEDARAAARAAALSMIATLARALGDLDRVTAWLTVHGMVNAAPGFGDTTSVMNAFSELILGVYGPAVGSHARTAIGVCALPRNQVVVVSAEVEIAT